MTIGPTLIQNSLKIGERLCASDLISPHQLETALYEQNLYNTMRLGEILVLHGWVLPETADFFGDQWPYLNALADPVPIGSYFRRAGLIDRNIIETILASQKKTGLRFGALAVLNGYIRQATLDFFVEQFYPNHVGEPPYMIIDPDHLDGTKPFVLFEQADEEPSFASQSHPEESETSSASKENIHWLN
ncbi:hypothetical protein [Acaryochloris sp. IP29b_bin.137]|uniref:hypothetical protein n=1 Tax=Acaryochloris sp. IP29b_bin.137 TaxID=2969217 RepID=UPI0026149E1C|nr:hypothetical protein [Acaryochloris sp. IP29b_bin.137]